MIHKKTDLAKDQELSFAVMNLIAIEEHLAMTLSKTKDARYMDIYDEIRKLRSKYMKQIIKNKEGEMWCISKHLLSTTMRLIETGVKHITDDREKAKGMFGDAAETYQLFWLLQGWGGREWE